MLLTESTDIPRYLIDSFETTLSRGAQEAEGTDFGRKYDLELPSLLRGLELADGSASVLQQVVRPRGRRL